jgi:RNA polymerase sigma-70 factor (ECF subfamily)
VNSASHLSGEIRLDEGRLIERARHGDQAAWMDLVSQHQEGVFRYAYLKLGDSAEAEDVAQETFLRAFRHLDRFDAERPLRPWLLTICANLARNQLRSAGRYWNALRRWLAERSIEAQTEARDPAGTGRLADRLQRVVRTLAEGDQDVLHARYFLELTVEETANVLQVAPGTVKSRQHRALNRLRKRIETMDPALGAADDDDQA